MVELNPNIAQQGANIAGPAKDPESTLDTHAKEAEITPIQNANGADTKALNSPEKTTTKLYQQAQITTGAVASFSLAELLASLPMIPTSLITQAENINEYGSSTSRSGVIGFSTTVLSTLSSGFRWLLNKHVHRSSDPNDVKVNYRSFLSSDLIRRIMHPNVVKEFTSLLFSTRRTLFSFAPEMFTVPSEEHDPDNPDGKQISMATTVAFNAASKLLRPFGLVSSVLTALIAIPAQVSSTLFAYAGEQSFFNISKYFSRVSDSLLPITSHLSTLLQVSKAAIFSRKTGASRAVAFGRYNINFLHVIQAIFGSITAIPYFFGSMVHFAENLTQRDQSDRLLLANNIRELVGLIGPTLKNITNSHESIAAMQEKAARYIEKRSNEISMHSSILLNKIFNSRALKWLSSKIIPTDEYGNVQITGTLNQSANEKTIFGGMRKSQLFSDLYELIHPLQSILMLLPNAFVSISDPYITDNGIRPVRGLDRLMGINSMLLSLPNFIIYSFSTRIPQIFLKWYEMKQNYAKANNKEYDASQDLSNFIDKCRHSYIFGAGYLAEILEKLDINSSTFHDSYKVKQLFNNLDEQARKQEPSVKASELVKSIRIGLRTILSKKWLAAQRDEQGYTDEEHSRMNIYRSLGTFKEGIGGIPIFGWMAAPLVELARKLYYVAPRKVKRFGAAPPTTTPIMTPAMAA